MPAGPFPHGGGREGAGWGGRASSRGGPACWGVSSRQRTGAGAPAVSGIPVEGRLAADWLTAGGAAGKPGAWVAWRRRAAGLPEWCGEHPELGVCLGSVPRTPDKRGGWVASDRRGGPQCRRPERTVLAQMAGPSGQVKGWGATSESSSGTHHPQLCATGLGDWRASRTLGSFCPEVLGDSGPHRVPGAVHKVPGGTGAGVLVAAMCQGARTGAGVGPPGSLVAPWSSALPGPGVPLRSGLCPCRLRVARGQGHRGPRPEQRRAPAPHWPLPLLFSDLLEVLSDVDEMSRRRPEVLGFFSVSGLGARGAHPPLLP